MIDKGLQTFYQALVWWKFKILTVSFFPVHSVAHLSDLSTLMNSLSPHTATSMTCTYPFIWNRRTKYDNNKILGIKITEIYSWQIVVYWNLIIILVEPMLDKKRLNSFAEYFLFLDSYKIHRKNTHEFKTFKFKNTKQHPIIC